MTKQQLIINPIVSEIAREFATRMFVSDTITDYSQFTRLSNTIEPPLLFTEDNVSVYAGTQIQCVLKGKIKFTITANQDNTTLYRNAGAKFYALTI